MADGGGVVQLGSVQNLLSRSPHRLLTLAAGFRPSNGCKRTPGCARRGEHCGKPSGGSTNCRGCEMLRREESGWPSVSQARQ